MIAGLYAHLVQSTLFAGGAALLNLLLRRNAAQVRHRVWFVASIKFLIPFSLLVGIGELTPRRAPAPSVQPVWIATAQQFVQPLSMLPVTATRTSVAPDGKNYLTMIALVLWFAGFAAIAFWWLIRWRRIHALRKSATPIVIPGTRSVATPIVSAPGIIEPGIVGILNPVLLLPEGIEKCLDPEQLDAILAHEFAHVCRRDNLTAAIHMTVQSIFWFHPLVWWLGMRLVDERERACDEEVLRLGIKPQIYAAGIINVCRFYVESPLTCMSGVTGADLKKRIHAIVFRRVTRNLTFAGKTGLTIVGLACLVIPVFLGVWNIPLMRGASGTSLLTSLAAPARFGSVSITPCTQQMQPGVANPSAGRLVLTCQWTASLVQLAYSKIDAIDPQDLTDTVAGLSPLHSVLVGQRVNIDARTETHASLEYMEGPMLRTLLEERFRLKTHIGTREVPMFSLSVERGTTRLHRADSEAGCHVVLKLYLPPPPLPPCSISNSLLYSRLDASGISIEDFARLLSGPLRQRVIDKTGINGKFDFHFSFANKSTPVSVTGLYRPLREVVHDQFGLKLDAFSGPRKFLVIDQVEKPDFY